MFLQRFLFRDIPRSAGLGDSEFQKLSAQFLKVRVLQLSFDVLLKIIIAVVNAKFFFFCFVSFVFKRCFISVFSHCTLTFFIYIPIMKKKKEF